MAYCTKNNLKYETIKLYLAGIRHFYIRFEVDTPLLHPEKLVQLQCILKGSKKSQSSVLCRKERLPITFDILVKLIKQFATSLCIYDSIMYSAICSMAFFGFMRCGEFTILSNTKFEPSSNLCVGDIDVSKTDRLVIKLKQSKADVFRKGITISIGSVESQDPTVLCPYKCMVGFWNLRRGSGAGNDDPLFVDSRGVILNRGDFITNMKNGIKELGMNPDLYNGHSFRIGAATTAARQNVPEHLIQTMGRWASDSYLRYIRTDFDSIRKAQNKMGCLK